MKLNLFNQFLELAHANNHEHCERTFMTVGDTMYYQPYGVDFFHRDSDRYSDQTKWFTVFMAEEPLKLSEKQKKEVLTLEEFVYNA